MSTRTIKAANLTRVDWWEFCTVTGYLETKQKKLSIYDEYPMTIGEGAVVVSGILMRAVSHAKNGWTELLIGPPQSPMTVWIESAAEITVEVRD